MITEGEIPRRLRDMLTNIDGAIAVVGDADFETYQSSFAMRKTAERCIEIISEASKHIPDAIKIENPEVPWPQVRSIGNVLRHHYSIIDDRVIWLTVKRSLPPLRNVVLRLLARYGGDENR